MGKFMDPWGTHLPVLASVVARTKGPVVELGAGNYSTPLLHLLCKGRRLLTAESNAEWMAKFEKLASPDHEFLRVKSWDDCPGVFDVPWSVAFVDHAPGSRRDKDLTRLATKATHIVLHDAQRHDYAEAIATFKHKVLWTWNRPHTIVLSQSVPFEL